MRLILEGESNAFGFFHWQGKCRFHLFSRF